MHWTTQLLGQPSLPNLSLDVPCFISSAIMNVARPACNIAPSFTADHCRSCLCIGPLSYWGKPSLPYLSLDVSCFISSTIMNVARPACNIATSFTADHCRSCQCIGPLSYWGSLLSLILAWMFPALYLVL